MPDRQLPSAEDLPSAAMQSKQKKFGFLTQTPRFATSCEKKDLDK